MPKKALITGVTGQDGSYLSELLLGKGYEVHGIHRRRSTSNTPRVQHLIDDSEIPDDQFQLHYGNMMDGTNINRLIERVKPDEIYNLAAQSNVAISFEQPEYTSNVNALGTLRLLDAIRETGMDVRFYQASTSEMFGASDQEMLDESSSFHPRSPYGTAKLYAYWIVRNYRESYDTFAVNGILFNHESPRRGTKFVTRKITRSAARIKHGLQEKLFLGNLNAERDWGYAPEYVEAMWRMLQQDDPDDYVIATGETHTVREFVERAFSHVGYEINWEGEGRNERGLDRDTGEVLVEVRSDLFRPADVETLAGDASKAESRLDWAPSTSFEELVELMVNSDLERIDDSGESFQE